MASPGGLSYAAFVGMSLHIPESEAAVGAAVVRAIAMAISGQPDPLLIAAQCEIPEQIPRRIRQAQIEARTARVPGFGRPFGPE